MSRQPSTVNANVVATFDLDVDFGVITRGLASRAVLPDRVPSAKAQSKPFEAQRAIYPTPVDPSSTAPWTEFLDYVTYNPDPPLLVADYHRMRQPARNACLPLLLSVSRGYDHWGRLPEADRQPFLDAMSTAILTVADPLDVAFWFGELGLREEKSGSFEQAVDWMRRAAATGRGRPQVVDRLSTYLVKVGTSEALSEAVMAIDAALSHRSNRSPCPARWRIAEPGARSSWPHQGAKAPSRCQTHRRLPELGRYRPRVKRRARSNAACIREPRRWNPSSVRNCSYSSPSVRSSVSDSIHRMSAPSSRSVYWVIGAPG
jgi:hypothetical protein